MYPQERGGRILAGAVLFAGLFAVFFLSPHITVTDSRYGLLAAEVLLTRGTLQLDGLVDSKDYRVCTSNGHDYPYFPAADSVLSVPFVAVMLPFGGSVLDDEGRYDGQREESRQKLLAALICAAVGVVIWRIAAQFTGEGAALAIAAAACLGSPIWGSASRAVWADTWGILLLSIALLMVVKPLRFPGLVALGTCLSWLYFVKPTFSVPITAVTAVVLWRFRLRALPLLLTGAVWLGLFLLWSRQTFGTWLPEYFAVSRLTLQNVPSSIAPHLISPSRGLLFYFPAALWAVWIVLRNWGRVRARDMATAAFATIILHYIVHAAHSSTAGHCYGARFSTALVPWFALLAAIGWRAASETPGRSGRLVVAIGIALSLLGVFTNGRGAIEPKTWRWNIFPADIDDVHARVWDWRRPQFLADMLPDPLILPGEFPSLPAGIDFRDPGSAPFLVGGWDATETEGRWSMGANAGVIFSTETGRGILVRMTAHTSSPQRVLALLNGETVWKVKTQNDGWFTVDFTLPGTLVGSRNVLEFRFPDRRILSRGEQIVDSRELGLMVRSLEFLPAE